MCKSIKFMYSEQLEALVKSIVADGKITEKERSVLHKKAAAEGVDADEIDVYVEGLISQMINDGKGTTFMREHDLTLFTKEMVDYGYKPIYYKLKKAYLLESITSNRHNVRDIQISFMDVTDANNKEYEKNWERFVGMGLLFSVRCNKKLYACFSQNLCFSTTDGDEIVSFYYDREYGKFQLQNICKKPADKTWGYIIDKEQLKALCDAKDIQVQFQDNSEAKVFIRLTETPLPGFQYYAQYFYRTMIDSEAYPDAETKLKEILKEWEKEKLTNLTEQQVAGMLSRKIKGKRKRPTPYYMSQHNILDTIVTDVRGRIVTRKDNEENPPHLFLHAISTKGNEHVFFLCLTTRYWSDSKRSIILSINLQDHTLSPVTDNESFLSDKNPHKEGEEYRGYNFYEIDSDTLNLFLNAKVSALKMNSYGDEYKIRSIPRSWKKSVALLNTKDGLKKWTDETGGFSKFCQTYFFSIYQSVFRLFEPVFRLFKL